MSTGLSSSYKPLYTHMGVGFSRQEYWSGLPFPSPGDLPDSGIEPRSPALQADSLLSEPPGKPMLQCYKFYDLFIWVINCNRIETLSVFTIIYFADINKYLAKELKISQVEVIWNKVLNELRRRKFSAGILRAISWIPKRRWQAFPNLLLGWTF